MSDIELFMRNAAVSDAVSDSMLSRDDVDALVAEGSDLTRFDYVSSWLLATWFEFNPRATKEQTALAVRTADQVTYCLAYLLT